MVALLLRWEPLGAVAHFGNAAATVTLPWMLSVRGHKGKSREREGGGGVLIDGGQGVTGVVASQRYYMPKKVC
jgi:hypothetical protein